jgi:HK97 gp10 family phage protein
VVGLYIGDAGGAGNPGELPPARRWHFIEFGTADLAAHPYLRPALDANADAVLTLLRTELQASIDRALRKKNR